MLAKDFSGKRWSLKLNFLKQPQINISNPSSLQDSNSSMDVDSINGVSTNAKTSANQSSLSALE